MKTIATRAARVLIVDDRLQDLQFLRPLMESEGYEVLVASSGQAARRVLKRFGDELDLVLLDLVMPDASGLDLLRALRASGSTVPVLCISARHDLPTRVEALRAGADDFLAKPFIVDELTARAGAILRRTLPSRHKFPSTIRLGGVELDPSRLKVKTPQGVEEELTATELRLLECLMRNAGRLLTRHELIRDAWSSTFDGNVNTVDAYVSRLRKKIEPDPANPTYIRTVHGEGYLFSKAA